jgi:K+-transporting ATPase ATPase C chain
MASVLPSFARQHVAAIRALLVLTVLTGVVYPLVVTGVAQVVARDNANGQLLSRDGKVVGSRLIGQSFADAKGNPLPQYFQPRPSSAGKTGYDATSSSASNLGPNNPDLVKAIGAARSAIAAADGVPASQVPPDAVTGSGSGLDPDISPAYAAIQVERVAAARKIDVAVVRRLVAQNTSGRDAGFIGAPHVNVLDLNLALDALAGSGAGSSNG